MKKMMTIALCALMLLGLLTGCSGTSNENVLILGTSADYPPFEFHMVTADGKDEFAGIDVSVAKQIAADMGKDLEITDISFANLLTALDKGEIDMILAAMEIDPKREGSADYSDAYYSDTPYMILMKKENVDKYTDVSSFAGVTVGTQTGTVMESIVTDDMKGADLMSLSSVTDLVNNLVYDKCTALVLNGAVAQEYAANDPSLAVSPIDLNKCPTYHVAVAEGDPKGLLPAINASIAKMKENGSIETFIQQAEADNAFALVG